MPGLPALSPEAVDAIVAFIGTGENRDVAHAGATSGGQPYRFTGYKRFLDPDGYPGDRAAVGHADRHRPEHRRARLADPRSASTPSWPRRA